MAELEANFNNPNICEEYINRLQNLKQIIFMVLYATNFEVIIYHISYKDKWVN